MACVFLSHCKRQWWDDDVSCVRPGATKGLMAANRFRLALSGGSNKSAERKQDEEDAEKEREREERRAKHNPNWNNDLD